jgi:two-component system OmpR family response regulator
VDAALDGEEALHLGDTEPYDAVVLDLGLPRMDGLTVLRRWRAAGRAMPVLILTAAIRGAKRSRGSMPAPTTTWPSPSPWRSWWRGSTR